VPQLSAHRGGPEALLEPNSLEAIRAAVELGVDLIEFDVRVTGDGQYIVYHDDRLRIEGQVRLVAQCDAAEIFRADPFATSLQAVLDVIRGRAMGHVDLKDTRDDVQIAELCLTNLGPTGFVLTTLEDETVHRVRQTHPQLLVGLSLSGTASRSGRLRVGRSTWSEIFPQARIRRCDANLLAVQHRLARFGVLSWAHRRRLPVLVWTVNTERHIRAAQRDPRVWAYTTDFPRLALRLATEAAEATARAGQATAQAGQATQGTGAAKLKPAVNVAVNVAITAPAAATAGLQATT
jgi:glycerophosphoryl diester phosphodiesterase